jgi:hypothetical protein
MDIRRIAAGVAVAGTLAVGVVGAAQPAVAAPAPTAGWQVVETFPLDWDGLAACWGRTTYYTGQSGVLKAECRSGAHTMDLWVNYK